MTGRMLVASLVVALVVATRRPWKERARALAWGAGLVQVYVAGLLTLVLLYMMCANPWLDLWAAGPFWQRMIVGLNDLFVTSYQGRRYGVALLIWVLVSFRREDLARFKS